jgi:ribosomal protein L37AE/L43A
MNRRLERADSPAPRRTFLCPDCGYGAVRRSSPARCPMCGGAEWEELGWKPFAALPEYFTARLRYAADDDAANEPMRREAAEVAAEGALPAVATS